MVRVFLSLHYPRLVSGLALICGSRAVAEDAVQEALARAWERTERGQSIDSLQAWVTRVAFNLVRSGFRRLLVERRHGSFATPIPRPVEDLVDLRRALGSLPRRQREVTVLRYYLDLDVAEVAAVLGVSDGTVKKSLHRARQTLAKALGEREETDDHARP